jgi:hypothetical protein
VPADLIEKTRWRTLTFQLCTDYADVILDREANVTTN